MTKANELAAYLYNPVSVSEEKEYEGAAADPSEAKNVAELVKLPFNVKAPVILAVPQTSKLKLPLPPKPVVPIPTLPWTNNPLDGAVTPE
ncbi:hypothetical protein HYW41_00990 [Candidatus Daviesbacteria bacterium]|nr:hypothetical protein [Candidatus Daviesbacteria bacterium]